MDEKWWQINNPWKSVCLRYRRTLFTVVQWDKVGWCINYYRWLIAKEISDLVKNRHVRNNTIQNGRKQTIRIKTKKFRISYYLHPLVFDFMILTICCKSWLFQTLISHERWCSTEEENNWEMSSRTKTTYLEVWFPIKTTSLPLPPLQSNCGSCS